VSNPDKVYFPERGITKADVVRYFLSVADGIFGAVRERPTMLERWTAGVRPGAKLATWQGKGDAFMQRRLPKGAPDWVQSARVVSPNGTVANMVCPTEPAVVAWAANLGTLRFHPLPARRPDLDHPDQLRIDLDPQPGTSFGDAVRVGLELRALFDEHGLTAFPKTSGGRGLHVYVPIEPRWPMTEVRRGVIAVGRELVRRMPDAVTINWWKEERGERIFLDYNQMTGTMTSAYSIRPTPEAKVSAPVTWDELPDVEPEDLDVLTMPDRFAAVGDPHAGLDGPAFSIEPLLELADRDERDGVGGDLPYPPNFPKMPGEPKRVQPSRARDPGVPKADADGEAVAERPPEAGPQAD
jgi:DNA ligase D-like protein (predicted polymerase)